MKITVLVDNNTLIDRYLLGEPAFSLYIEADRRKILFDTGYSDAFLINARKLDIDLRHLDMVVISHGHMDHTWGLEPLIRLLSEAEIEGQKPGRPTLIAHPGALAPKTLNGSIAIGSLLTDSNLDYHFTLQTGRDPVRLTDNLFFLGEIDRTHVFEKSKPLGRMGAGDSAPPDFLSDDTALAYTGEEGLVILSGCSHAGICNIISQAQKVCGDNRIRDIIGGLHLLNPSEERLRGTCDFLHNLHPTEVHACHCTDLRSKVALAGRVNLKEVGSGWSEQYD